MHLDSGLATKITSLKPARSISKLTSWISTKTTNEYEIPRVTQTIGITYRTDFTSYKPPIEASKSTSWISTKDYEIPRSTQKIGITTIKIFHYGTLRKHLIAIISFIIYSNETPPQILCSQTFFFSC